MNILVVSVHPDDETLGCGGTILKHKKLKDNIFWMIVTSPTRDSGYSQDFITERKDQINRVEKAYGFNNTFQLNFPTTRLHSIDFTDIIKKMARLIEKIKPEVIYSVNRSDIHTDHQITAKALASCTKAFRAPSIKKILMYECLSETEFAPALPENVFIPNIYSDISEFLEEKIQIMGIYQSEIHPSPMPRSFDSLRALARYRGTTICTKYAEAFMLIKEIF